ncbi:MAG TPA: transposase, partial [Candidatus Methanoculleus thermohydrogenotrophicum]|nr:transposase [Candidatus Methanoculleus thermohydrogenotrophicum]
AVGGDRAAQQMVFQHLSSRAQHLVYDLSFVFSCSDTVNLAEFGYNADDIWLPQVNIALFSATDTGLPVMIRSLPGSVRDVAALLRSLQEIDTTGATLVLDRGFVSEANENLLRESGIQFVLPERRNSTRHETRIHLTDHFFYHKRLIHAGKREVDGMTLHLYEDVDLAAEEGKTLNRRLKRVGRILVVSSLTVEPRVVYDLYRSRNLVEEHFSAFKNLIQADKLYLRDATAVFGHVFVGFLCLYLYSRILNRIKKAGMTAPPLAARATPDAVGSGEERVITEVPKQVRKIPERPGLEIFPNT